MEFSESLKKNRGFSGLSIETGNPAANKYLVMYLYRRDGSKNRVGISVKHKKVGNSVVRHRITRLIRESYRLNEKKIRWRP